MCGGVFLVVEDGWSDSLLESWIADTMHRGPLGLSKASMRSQKYAAAVPKAFGTTGPQETVPACVPEPGYRRFLIPSGLITQGGGEAGSNMTSDCLVNEKVISSSISLFEEKL